MVICGMTQSELLKNVDKYIKQLWEDLVQFASEPKSEVNQLPPLCTNINLLNCCECKVLRL